ncbi:hypothetical protein FM123_05660 [Limosilactobacillus fermentum]|nr:hypothetical protein FM122_05555 [Limosilactobacillus fermentum]SJM56433.1 hypothetical protein FM123_05660 [Limosilactobacillus fermentum]
MANKGCSLVFQLKQQATPCLIELPIGLLRLQKMMMQN